MIKKIDHLVITTAQIGQCLDFYKNIGFEAREREGRYELFAGDFKINIHILGNEFLPHAGHVKPGSADLCFETDMNMEELYTSLQSRGLEVELGVVERTGTFGSMRSLYLRDPDNNLIEFCSYG